MSAPSLPLDLQRKTYRWSFAGLKCLSWRDLAGPLSIAVSVSIAVCALEPLRRVLLNMWSDPLRSIGVAVPLISVVLILRAWRGLRWSMDGSWMGLAVVALSLLLMRASQMVIAVQFGSGLTIPLVSNALVWFTFACGVTLLFGGMRLLRAARFPVALMLLVNPVPTMFEMLADHPLQQASATVAREFAVLLKAPLSGEDLQLMFAPHFGMFIAPGCNGIRGAVTLGLLALVAGHLIRLRRVPHVVAVVCAVLMGYVCNFVRLCALVLYYVAGVHWPGLRHHGALIDYILGGALFLVCSYVFVQGMLHLRSRPSLLREVAVAQVEKRPHVAGTHARAVGLIVVSLLLGAGPLHALLYSPARRMQPVALPEQVGAFRLVRTWHENVPGGDTAYIWASYASESGLVTVGVSPTLGVRHDVAICHRVRGEFPVATMADAYQTAGEPLRMQSFLYKRPELYRLEASAPCKGGRCGLHASDDTSRVQLIWSGADGFLNTADGEPLVLYTETDDVSAAPGAAQAMLQARVQSFLQKVDVPRLVQALNYGATGTP